MPCWSDAGSGAARDYGAASRSRHEAQPSTRTNHVLRCACFIILPSSDACPVGMCSRRRHTHSHRVRVRSWQLWSTSPLAPCCSCLAAGCRSLHCFTGGAGCAHASGCGKPQLRVPSHVKRAPIVVPFFLPHHSDSRYACMAREHERTARPRHFLDVRYPADASRMHKYH